MTRDELQKILDDHANWLKGDGGKKANLRGANLNWANLSKANLRWTDLRWTNLQGANLQGANLRGADLLGADLRWTNLLGADMRWTNLRGADLRGVNLRGVNLHDANLRGANLSGARSLYLLPVQDPRGYSWPHAVQCEDGVWRIRAGCRFFTIPEARNHWGPSYAGERRMGDMYLATIDWLERVIAEDAAITKMRGGER